MLICITLFVKEFPFLGIDTLAVACVTSMAFPDFLKPDHLAFYSGAGKHFTKQFFSLCNRERLTGPDVPSFREFEGINIAVVASFLFVFTSNSNTATKGSLVISERQNNGSH